ncbi:MAG TPA: SGNH/GDSL hydrolase family protein [Cyclobacteriaceae bacterium]|nr:SGNH/GDSL hydrolase family protein [Cyclobacteriaceae bacterium]
MTKTPMPTTVAAIALLMLIFITCEKDALIERKYIIVGTIQKVLILGNSITITRPAPEIGWFGDWGMAATSADNDYVHLLINKFKTYNDSIEVRFASISHFERQFWDFDYSQLKDFQSFAPDLIIIRIGENVNEEDARNREFQKYLHELITYLRNGRQIAICNTGTFWKSPAVTEQIEAISEKENYIFVPLSDLSNKKSNLATDQYVDPGVSAHPSDKGMKEIADRIARTLGLF